MPVWPKSFYTFGVSLKTAATEWELRQKRGAAGVQERTWRALVPRLAATKHWRSAGVESGMPYAKFQSRVPLQTYAHLVPAIERMRAGETDVLWPGRCAFFAQSSGTTQTPPKLLPVTEEMLAHFRRAGMEALLYYTVRARNAGIFRGRHLLLGGSTALHPLDTEGRNEAYAANLSGIVEVNLPRWAERHIYEPGASAARTPDWEDRLDQIIARTTSQDITLLAGLPDWVILLAREIQQRSRNAGQPVARLQDLWPNLECFLHTGIPLTPFGSELRTLLGPNVAFHEVYAAAEGFVATQDTDIPAQGQRLMANLGLFFEFLPMSDFEEARLPALGAKTVPLAEVKVGMDYALVLTTPGGLVRTLLGDVVRFVSVQPPRLVYVGRTALELNRFGEHVSEKEITDSLAAVCARHDWVVMNFHVAPLLAKAGLTGQVRGGHEWWIELKPGTIATPKGPPIAEGVDAQLQQMNRHYATRRRAGSIEPPIVRLVMPGVFEHWLRFKGTWGGQHRLPRSRNDREIADQLAQITNFAQD